MLTVEIVKCGFVVKKGINVWLTCDEIEINTNQYNLQ